MVVDLGYPLVIMVCHWVEAWRYVVLGKPSPLTSATSVTLVAHRLHRPWKTHARRLQPSTAWPPRWAAYRSELYHSENDASMSISALLERLEKLEKRRQDEYSALTQKLSEHITNEEHLDQELQKTIDRAQRADEEVTWPAVEVAGRGCR